MLRDLAPLFAKPVAAIYNSSIQDDHEPPKSKQLMKKN